MKIDEYMVPEESDISCLREKLKREVISELDLNRDVEDEEVRKVIDKCILRQADTDYIPLKEKLALKVEIYNSIRKLDILSELLEDDTVSEIMINGPDNIFVEQNGIIRKTDKSFDSPYKLMAIIQNIASSANRLVNDSNPIVDVILEDGSRVNIVLSGVSLDGTAVTIRKFPKERFDMKKLTDIGSIDEGAANFLKMMVRAGYNIFISGGTGSGKTTFLNALADYIPEDERVITIEDTAELRIKGVDNLVRLEVKNANVEGSNSISIKDLIRASLRMRPDRIIVGEVRDEAAIDMLAAMNTGHDGSISTGHANSVKDMMLRLETMVLMGADLPIRAIRQQIAAALDIVVHLGRLRDRSRRVLEISEVTGMENDEIVLRPLYIFEEEKASKKMNGGSDMSRKTDGYKDKDMWGIDMNENTDDIGPLLTDIDKVDKEFFNGYSASDFEEVNEKKEFGRNKVRLQREGRVEGRLRKINDLMNVSKLEFAGLINIYREEAF
ncbi:pilus assembly protein CpaF [Eubacterium ruminantium]|nr:pilus assembly protein CpaF [Eubacterium ruminantium]